MTAPIEENPPCWNTYESKDVSVIGDNVYTEYSADSYEQVQLVVHTMHGGIISQFSHQMRPDLVEQVHFAISDNIGHVCVPKGDYVLDDYLLKLYEDPAMPIRYPLISPTLFSNWVHAMETTAPYIPYDIHLGNIAFYSPDCLLMFDYEGVEEDPDLSHFVEMSHDLATIMGIPYNELPDILQTTEEDTWNNRLQNQFLLTELRRAQFTKSLTANLVEMGFDTVVVKQTRNRLFESVRVSNNEGTWVLVQEKDCSEFLSTLRNGEFVQFLPSGQDTDTILDSLYDQSKKYNRNCDFPIAGVG